MENLSIILSCISLGVLFIAAIYGLNIVVSDSLKSASKNDDVKKRARENDKLESARLKEDDSIPSLDDMMW